MESKRAMQGVVDGIRKKQTNILWLLKGANNGKKLLWVAVIMTLIGVHALNDL